MGERSAACLITILLLELRQVPYVDVGPGGKSQHLTQTDNQNSEAMDAQRERKRENSDYTLSLIHPNTIKA